MKPTIYASFDTLDAAKAAIGDLIRNGVPADDLTLACKHLTHQIPVTDLNEAADLNPAQDDYPRTGSAAPAELSSAPPEAERDYNRGIEEDRYNAHYDQEVGAEMTRDLAEDRRRAEGQGASSDAGLGPPVSTPHAANPDPAFETSRSERPDRDADNQMFGAMPESFPDLRASGPGNSVGDPSVAGLGTRSAGIAATANASTGPGAMTDFLWQSLPPDVAHYYQREYDGGKAIVVVRDPSDAAFRVLQNHRPNHIERQGYLA